MNNEKLFEMHKQTQVRQNPQSKQKTRTMYNIFNHPKLTSVVLVIGYILSQLFIFIWDLLEKLFLHCKTQNIKVTQSIWGNCLQQTI